MQEDKIYKEFNSEKDKELNIKAQAMFDNLRKHLGEEVLYTGWLNGTKQEIKANLNNVHDFINIGIGSYITPFVGNGSAIISITTKDGEILYSNPYLEDNYNKTTNEEISLSEELMFGKLIGNNLESKLEDQINSKPIKELLIDEGLDLVREETKEEWTKFVEINCKDNYSILVVKVVLSMLKKLEKNVSFEEAEKQVYQEEFNLNNFVIKVASYAVSHFAKKGEEYKNYWNNKYGSDISNEIRIIKEH